MHTLIDTDKDGISDVHELYGFCSSGDCIDYPTLGANPNRKDLFIEVDIMDGITIPTNGFQDVVDAFGKAPVTNPNGTTGIDVHIDASGIVPYYAEIDFSSEFSAEGDRRAPRVAVNASGITAVVWQDDRDKNGFYQIYVRRFDATGIPLDSGSTVVPGHGELVNTTSDGQQRRPDVAINDAGEMVVVWEDDRDSNGYYEIYGRIRGVFTGWSSEIHINEESAGQQQRPSVGIDQAGNWLAVWEDDRDGNGYYNIYGRKFDSAGGPLGGEFRVNQVVSGQQRDIEIAMTPTGAAIVVWEDDADGNGYYEINAQRLNPVDGTPLFGTIVVNEVSQGQQRDPTVGINRNNHFVIAWEDDRDGNGYYEIFARRFTSPGNPAQGPEVHINDDSSGQQRDPAVAIDASGRFTVTWEDDRDKNGFYQIYARTFNLDGSPRTGDRIINTVGADQQVNPTIGVSDSGTYTVVYMDDRDKNNTWSLYMRQRNHTGASVSGDRQVHDYPRTFENLKSEYFTDLRDGHYFYGIIADKRVNTNSSGIACCDHFIVSLGDNLNTTSFADRTKFAGTFMHELGHSLSLKHGGNQNLNRKPNYVSVMNYTYQFWGADDDCDASSSSTDIGTLNYSSGHRLKLDENELQESLGICNGEQTVNWVSDGQQRDVDVEAANDGRFVVVWEDDRDKNGKYDIHARAYDASGQAIMTEKRVNRTATGQQQDPAVGIASNGRFVVVWEDDSDNNGFYEIRAQRLSAAGNRQGSTINVNTTSSGNQRNPDIAVAENGAFVVVWEDDRDGNGFYEIWARAFNANGSPHTGERHVNTTTFGQQKKPRVAIADDRRFVVVWEDDSDNNAFYNIYGQRFTSGGSKSGSELRINTTVMGQQRRPDVASAADGRFVVVWEDDSDNNGFGQIHARRYSSNGTALGSGVFTVNTTASGQQRRPRVTANDDFNFVVTWQDDHDVNGFYQIHARPYRENGTPRGAVDVVNSYSAGQQKHPDVGIDANNRYYVAWQDDRDLNTFYQVFAARLGATGARRDRVALDWNLDGDTTDSDLKADINNNFGNRTPDGNFNLLKDYNDWGNLDLKR